MQEQLDELRRLKVLRLSRITTEREKYGLLDSGATHPMRAKRKDEDLAPYEKVQVTLADGRQIGMHMTHSQVMVMDSLDAEPILRLGFSLHWRKGALEILHPEKDPLKVRMLNGCPQIPRTITLHLIEQLENGRAMKKAEVRLEEEQWLRGMVDAHPALRTFPEIVK